MHSSFSIESPAVALRIGLLHRVAPVVTDAAAAAVFLLLSFSQLLERNSSAAVSREVVVFLSSSLLLQSDGQHPPHHLPSADYWTRHPSADRLSLTFPFLVDDNGLDNKEIVIGKVGIVSW